MNPVSETGCYENISASTLIFSKPCQLLGIWVSSASSTPTIKVWDQTSAAAPIVANTFTPLGSTYYPIPASCVNGLYITISGTVDCTVFYAA